MDAILGGQTLAFWLIPGEPARSFFDSLIAGLAARFDAPLFEPHLTLYVTTPENKNAGELLKRALADCEPYRLSISGIDFSDAFNKTLFVQFRKDKKLSSLSLKLRSVSVSQSEYQLNPHLSLIYKTMPRETKASIARSLSLPFDEVVFDSVTAVISPAEIKSHEDVEAWQVLATQKFAR